MWLSASAAPLQEGDIMQSFTLDFGRSWFARLVGHNPLVRGSDRIEALALLVLAVIVLMAVPVVGAVGTALHDNRLQMYTEQAQSRHTVTATALHDGETIVHANSVVFAATARWNASGVNHVGVVELPGSVKMGDRVDVWVDRRGNTTEAPTPAGKAADEALGVAVLSWLAVAATASGFRVLLRARLNRSRHADWDRELGSLADDGRFTSGQ